LNITPEILQIVLDNERAWLPFLPIAVELIPVVDALVPLVPLLAVAPGFPAGALPFKNYNGYLSFFPNFVVVPAARSDIENYHDIRSNSQFGKSLRIVKKLIGKNSCLTTC
jgi:hypothetical protein